MGYIPNAEPYNITKSYIFLFLSVTLCLPSRRPRWRCWWEFWVEVSVWMVMERTGTARLQIRKRCWRWDVWERWCTVSWPAALIRDRWRSAQFWRVTSNCSTPTLPPRRRSKVAPRRPAHDTGRAALWRYRWTCSVSVSHFYTIIFLMSVDVHEISNLVSCDTHFIVLFGQISEKTKRKKAVMLGGLMQNSQKNFTICNSLWDLL